MIVGIHQPNFIPWYGYFDKISKSDKFVYLDTVQFSRFSYTQRTKLKSNTDSSRWLTVPVSNTGINTIIRDCKINSAEYFFIKLKSTIKYNYKKFDNLVSAIDDFSSTQHNQSLSMLNMVLIESITQNTHISLDRNLDGIDRAEFILASELDTKFPESEVKSNNAPSRRLLSIILSIGGSQYITGKGGLSYIDLDAFKYHGISIIQTDTSKYVNSYSILEYY